ncbi:MAG: arginase [Planctomycetes bacterium]|nr:arginase [Planctomycetota bacterium]MCB9904261.1 arginase [Planctomycetota bacterium]
MSRKVSALGVPMDLGGGRRGVDMGPSAMRIAGLERAVRSLGLEFEDLGNVHVDAPERRDPRDPHARFLSEIAACCRELRDEVQQILSAGSFPLVIGGDHSIAVGTVAGISSFHHARNERVGLIWFDAHSDMNTPRTSPSGNIHGMPLASVLGFGPEELVQCGSRTPMVDVENAVLVGVRSIDPTERELVRESGIKCYTMREVDMLGMHRVMKEAIEIATDGTVGFHLSFDLDGTDPSVAPGVGTPVPGGTNYRESHLVMEMAAASQKLLALEMTEINPILDDRNTTARAAVELVLSGLGKTIL